MVAWHVDKEKKDTEKESTLAQSMDKQGTSANSNVRSTWMKNIVTVDKKREKENITNENIGQDQAYEN